MVINADFRNTDSAAIPQIKAQLESMQRNLGKMVAAANNATRTRGYVSLCRALSHRLSGSSLRLALRSLVRVPRAARDAKTLTGFNAVDRFALWRVAVAVHIPANARGGARRYRGMVTALHGGANAVRFRFVIPMA